MRSRQKKSRHLALIKSARGMFRPKPGDTSFAARRTKLSIEDRELEQRRDERLAALIRK